MSEPEHISGILKRVFDELEKQYGGCPLDLNGALPSGPPSQVERETKNGRLDKTSPATFDEWMVRKS